MLGSGTDMVAYSPKCVEVEFSEVRNRWQRLSNGKDHSFGGCVAIRFAGNIYSNTPTPDDAPLQIVRRSWLRYPQCPYS
jgi:hypothetical protein